MNSLRFVAIILSMAWAATSFSQTMTDVIHLKNGSMIRGVIIEQVPNESLKIQTRDGSVLVFQMTEVARITKEVDHVSNTSSPDRGETSSGGARTGYANHTAVGFGMGIDSDMSILRLETVNGIWLGRGIMSLGLGVGIEYFTSTEIAQVPVFLDVRILPIKGDVTPAIILQGGLSAGEHNESLFFDGPQVAVGLGVHAALASVSALNVSVLYDELYNSIRLSAGLSF